VIALLVPIAALTMALSRPVVYLVFSHTRMETADLNATAAALIFFSLGMFFWGAQNILARGFYATRMTWLPAIVGTLVTVAALPMYSLLAHYKQHIGLALASSLAMSAYAITLFFLLNRRTHNRDAGALMAFFGKVLAASAVTGVICYRLRLVLEPHFAWQKFGGAFLLLALVTSAGILLLLLLGRLLRIREMDQQIARLWRLASGAFGAAS
jgi:putative peptidoglycan lipid II flippase